MAADLAVAGERELSVMVWNYTDDAVPGESVDMTMVLKGMPAGAKRFRHFRIDEEHSNAYETWKRMGAPQQVGKDMFHSLEKAGQLAGLMVQERVEVPAAGEISVSFMLPAHGVSLLKWNW